MEGKRVWWCVSSGIIRQYLQPESQFSIEYISSGVSPYKSLRFFEGAQENTICGSSGLTLATGVRLPVDSNGWFIERPESVIAEGDTQKLVWSGFQLASTKGDSLMACICDYEYVASSEHLNGTCSTPADFNIHGGLLKITGETLNRKEGHRWDGGAPFLTEQILLLGFTGVLLAAMNECPLFTPSKDPSLMMTVWSRRMKPLALSFFKYQACSSKPETAWTSHGTQETMPVSCDLSDGSLR